ncbi:MAG: type II toxin-antitoxin system HicA family toxin [Bacillota bacterium]|nr:type II toxin-antitoxin system HicA family toxin [Bacillota bacterium]
MPLHVLAFSCQEAIGTKACSSREVLGMLREDGWEVKAQRGSHVLLVHSLKPGKVTVPHPRKSLPVRTVQSILQQAGIEQRSSQGPDRLMTAKEGNREG